MEELAFTESPPPAASLRSALIIVSTLPVLFVYPFIQRYFVTGVMIGGIKG
jgi:putative aldouronate transport system permease protein